MIINVLTGFPDIFTGPLQNSIIWQAQKKNLLSVNIINLRDFTSDKYKSIDDYPFGGGGGMVLKCDPVFKAMDQLSKETVASNRRVILPTPQGELFTQKKAREFVLADELILIGGRYKGVDERITRELVTDEISIGDFILTGGELPILIIIDAVARLLPAVLNNFESAQTDSFEDGLLDCAYYTRPDVYRGLEVPKVLLSGDHKRISEYRLQEKIDRTKKRRPDMYNKYMDDN